MNFVICLAAILLFLMFGIILLFRLPQFGKLPDYNSNDKIKNSKQFHNKAFCNTYFSGKLKFDRKKFVKLMKSFFKSKSIKRPPKNIVLCAENQVWKDANNRQGNSVTWFGHSSVMVDIDGKRLLIDPVFGKYASPFRGAVKRFDNSLHLSDADFNRFGKIDAVIFSHDHYDHLDYFTIKKLRNSILEYFVPLGVGDHLKRWGVKEDRITELDWWDEVDFKGLKLVCTPSQHFSGRNPFKQNSSLWCSWVIVGCEKTLFFSGDSGYFQGFKEIGNKYGPFNLAMLECGQYNELWHEIHMMPEETVMAGYDLNAGSILPIHNSKFCLSVHSWDEPLNRLNLKAENTSANITKILQGETLRL